MHGLFNPLNAELNPICHLLALFGAHQILHVSRTRVNLKLNETDVTDFLLTLFSILYTTIASFFSTHPCQFAVSHDAKPPISMPVTIDIKIQIRSEQ